MLPLRVDADVETLERSRAEDHHVVRFREHDEVWSFCAGCMDDCDAELTLELPPVGDDEALRELRPDSEVLSIMIVVRNVPASDIVGLARESTVAE